MTLHFDWAAFLWMLGGAIGLIVRLRLYQKFQGDIAAQPKTLNGFRRSISRRSLEMTRIHVLLKAGIVLIGLSAMLVSPEPTSTTPTLFGLLVTGFLILLPFALAFDAIREYSHQKHMLDYALVLATQEHSQDTRAAKLDKRSKVLDERAEGLEAK